MSHSSINRAANDPQLQDRVKAAVYKFLYTNDEARSSMFGQAVLNNFSGTSNQLTAMQWAVAVATEAQYESALINGNGSPGFDVSVITDGLINDTIALKWPMQQPPTYPEP